MISNDYKPKIGIMLENLKHNGFNGELISCLFLKRGAAPLEAGGGRVLRRHHGVLHAAQAQQVISSSL